MVKGCEKAPSANMRQPFSAEAQIGMAPFRGPIRSTVSLLASCMRDTMPAVVWMLQASGGPVKPKCHLILMSCSNIVADVHGL